MVSLGKPMQTEPVLTIAIPTYNRLDELCRLIQWLETETTYCRSDVEVIISDNDSAPDVRRGIEQLLRSHNWMEFRSQRVNVGPDANFLDLVRQVKTPYFWLLSDDDLPASGLIQSVVRYVRAQQPDLLYLPSLWSRDELTVHASRHGSSELLVKPVSAQALARFAHVNVTFISSWVVRRDRWVHEAEVLVGSNLLQLSWILSCLKLGSRFAVAQQVCILARSGNTGGYKLLSVFGKNLPATLNALLADRRDLALPILSRLGWTYLPALIWLSRRKAAQTFVQENSSLALRFWSERLCHKVLHRPLLKLPMPMASIFFLASKAIDRVWQYLSKLRLA